MSRNIVTTAHLKSDVEMKEFIAKGQQPPPQTPDNYSTQIIKLIPADVVGVYLGISSLIETQKLDACVSQYIQWPVFACLLIITPLYLWRAAGVTDKKQIIIAAVSFVIWAFSLGGPFESLFGCLGITPVISIKLIGGIVIMIYTLIVPIIYQKVNG